MSYNLKGFLLLLLGVVLLIISAIWSYSTHVSYKTNINYKYILVNTYKDNKDCWQLATINEGVITIVNNECLVLND